ncbi:uncharacterized protein LOC110444496 [Mizuhopecten yessoensis]|uniref:uncharacterized protein LOC110444496 n=1 Tax=Mizuhopecten yessoensis TaxID=6573 RepID=UPI000B45E8A6|nr:uncharacterized protein LOC110444496 [Mizuhopecten yessoensis]
MVINVHSRPDEEYIPNWLRRVTISVFMPMGFWKGSCSPSGCCKKKVEPKQTKTINVVSVSKIKLDVNEKSMSVVEDYDSASLESNDHQLSWQIVSQVLDAMFFNVFMWVIVLTSIVFFGILSNEFANI